MTHKPQWIEWVKPKESSIVPIFLSRNDRNGKSSTRKLTLEPRPPHQAQSRRSFQFRIVRASDFRLELEGVWFLQHAPVGNPNNVMT